VSDQYPPQNPYGQQPGGPQGQGQDQPWQQPGQYAQQPGGAPQYGAPAPTGPGGEPPLWAPWYGISLPNAVRRFFTKYVRFDGRASRSEYWWWALTNFIVLAVLYTLYGIGAATSESQTVSNGSITTTAMTSPSVLFVIAGILIGIWGLGTIIPNLAITWRRLHDANFAGPFYFLAIIPIVGPIILLVFLVMGSKPEGQRFDRPERG
jgi:uncharacterized membrane protein YhaH (DUF805 family)